jgi:hypothetical protein
MSPPTPRIHAGRAQLQYNLFLILVVAAVKLTLRHGHFTDGNRTPGTHSTDNWFGPGTSLKVLEKINISYLRMEWNPGSSRSLFMALETIV